MECKKKADSGYMTVTSDYKDPQSEEILDLHLDCGLLNTGLRVVSLLRHFYATLS